ncbi:MAG: peptidoglycan-associated lipoprotein Pal [Oligoflexales bacterium]|nr:peptidoglycan-associated lipoprotein Pal [Oligoflexales bacterium]
MVIRKILISVAAGLGTLYFTACTDNNKKVENVVQTDASADAKKKAEKDKDAFTVDKDTGVVEFKAEIVYFKYDDSTLTEEGMSRLKALADYMKKNQTAVLSIEGHCDERGSVEYNLALGNRRSDSVKEFLKTVGIDDSRLKTVSFGKEKPAVTGSNEESWSKNRRAEFKFLPAGDKAASDKPAVTEAPAAASDKPEASAEKPAQNKKAKGAASAKSKAADKKNP